MTNAERNLREAHAALMRALLGVRSEHPRHDQICRLADRCESLAQEFHDEAQEGDPDDREHRTAARRGR